MGRASRLVAAAVSQDKAAIDAEVETEVMAARPDEITAEDWSLIQENASLATERLNDILRSPQFVRYKPADKARLIKLAQDRAWGTPKSNTATALGKRGGQRDATQATLDTLVAKAALPEYKRTDPSVVEDAEEIDD